MIYYEREWVYALLTVLFSLGVLWHAWRHRSFLPLALCFAVVLNVLWVQDCYVWKTCSEERLDFETGSAAGLGMFLKTLSPWLALIDYFATYFLLRRLFRPWVRALVCIPLGASMLAVALIGFHYLIRFIAEHS